MNNKEPRVNVNILMLLQVVFIALKVSNVIDWSWGRVFIPLWINVGIIAIVVMASIIALLVEESLSKRK
jgi:hypothetical protein